MRSSLSPTLGALVGRAAAVANVREPAEALKALDAIDPRSVLNYQPYWAVRADILARLGEREPARDAYSRAIGLSEDPQVRAYLIRSRESASA